MRRIAAARDRAQVADFIKAIREVTDATVEITFVDQGFIGEDAANAAESEGVRLEVVKHVEAKRGFVPPPRRWGVERSFGWLGRVRRLARGYERLNETLCGCH